MPATRPLLDRIRTCLAKHPDWTDERVRNAVRGASTPLVRAVREGRDTSGLIPGEQAPGPAPEPCGPAIISLDHVRLRYDVAGSIRNELARLKNGSLILERELRAKTAGRDANRFRRAVENNEEFKANRIFLKLDPESNDGAWYWGTTETISKAKSIRDE